MNVVHCSWLCGDGKMGGSRERFIRKKVENLGTESLIFSYDT